MLYGICPTEGPRTSLIHFQQGRPLQSPGTHTTAPWLTCGWPHSIRISVLNFHCSPSLVEAYKLPTICGQSKGFPWKCFAARPSSSYDSRPNKRAATPNSIGTIQSSAAKAFLLCKEPRKTTSSTLQFQAWEGVRHARTSRVIRVAVDRSWHHVTRLA
ncbi:hypothetical protein PpBr36_02514 [Pyricularia pennisetigena]|uniref:hypothetical protein n=1 Tax=Pyricularia pennisetigena TaxID=1578925 RepID=UPI00114EE4E4|nr:hypothetical protein PpBr36_02514 [Pyricularia pennisetigena]TLS31498.1 hypothetical protein PpBr36_02514 [Pyricularia pennisetigena]